MHCIRIHYCYKQFLQIGFVITFVYSAVPLQRFRQIIVMQPNFKLFLSNHRLSSKEQLKSKQAKVRSFRMHTHNIIEISKQLSARVKSQEKPDAFKQPNSIVLQKLQDFSINRQGIFPIRFKNEHQSQATNYRNFKVSFTNREPLKFRRPEMRYRNSMDKPKKICSRNEKVNVQKAVEESKKAVIVEYLTEYGAEQPNKRQNADKSSNSKHLRRNMNVLRNKLKKHFMI